MKKTNRWDVPDWSVGEPVKFTGLHLGTGSVLTAILLGGILMAIALAVWHMSL